MRFVVAAAAFSVIVLSCHPHDRSTAAPPHSLTEDELQQANIRIEPLTEHEVDATLVASGRVAFDDSRVAHVFSAVSGRVVHIDADLGQPVKRGDALATLDAPDLGAASADLHKAAADLTAARHNYERQKTLYEKQAATRVDFERAQDEYLRNANEFQRVKQKLELLRGERDGHLSQQYVLTAPIDGTVLSRNISPGIEVQGLYGGSGNPVELFTVGAIDRVWVFAAIYETDLERVRVGAPVRVTTVAYPSETFTGRVDWIAKVLDPTTRTAEIRCTLDNPEAKLKPAMYATVWIVVAPRRALAVPREAVAHIGGQTGLFIAGEPSGGRTKFEYRPVAVDEHDPSPWAVVEGGVARGERVVVAGAPRLYTLF